MDGIGNASTRAVYVAPDDGIIDTLRFDDVVAYSKSGVPILVTFDFSQYDISNARIWRSVFDSATNVTMEIKAAGAYPACPPDGPTPCPPRISQLSIRETRMGADIYNQTTGTGGSGVLVQIANDTDAFIKTLEISNNYLISKAPNGYFIKIDAPGKTGVTGPGPIRSAQIVGNFFGDAVAGGGSGMAAAVVLGADNILVSGNTLQNAREETAAPPARINFFAAATRANINNVLISNVASVPLIGGFLDETVAQLGSGKQLVANTGATAPFRRTATLAANSAPIGGTATTVDGLTLSLNANTTYRAVGTFLWSSSSAVAGAGFAFNVFVAPELYASSCAISTNQNAIQTPTFYNARAPNGPMPSSSVDSANATMLTTCTALFRTTGVTNLNTRTRSSSTTATMTLLKGSMVEVEELPPS